jgi:hypothetical protein
VFLLFSSVLFVEGAAADNGINRASEDAKPKQEYAARGRAVRWFNTKRVQRNGKPWTVSFTVAILPADILLPYTILVYILLSAPFDIPATKG